ncbi:hypothetical protein [Halostagnicola bangensis]
MYSRSRRQILRTIVVVGLISLQGCVESLPLYEDEREDTAVLVVNNLTDDDVALHVDVRGSAAEVLYDDRLHIEAGKGYRTDPFDDDARTLEYELADDRGMVEIPTDPTDDSTPPRKLWFSYTTEDGLVYEQG